MKNQYKAVYSVSVIKQISNTLNEEIRTSMIGSKEMKKEIQKVLQKANRRAENIEKAGIASPAYQALMLEGRKGYSKFKITGYDINNEFQWELAKQEYAKAISFLNNPTSSATGARQYIKHKAKQYNVPFEVANNIITQATDIEFRDSQIPMLNYRSMVDSFFKESVNEKESMNRTAEEHAKELENNLQESVDNASEHFNKIMDTLEENLKKSFGLK